MRARIFSVPCPALCYAVFSVRDQLYAGWSLIIGLTLVLGYAGSAGFCNTGSDHSIYGFSCCNCGCLLRRDARVGKAKDVQLNSELNLYSCFNLNINAGTHSLE